MCLSFYFKQQWEGTCLKNTMGSLYCCSFPHMCNNWKSFLSSPPSGFLPVISCTSLTPLHFHYFFCNRSRFIVGLLNLQLDIKCFSLLLTLLLFIQTRKRGRDSTPQRCPLVLFKQSCLERFVDSLQKIPTAACMHCLLRKLLLHYKPHRNAVKLRASCLAEVMVSYIFRGLLCKTFPLGCIISGEIKNLCLSAGQASTYADSRLRVLLGLAVNIEHIAAITAKRESGPSCRQATQFPTQSQFATEKRRRGEERGRC